MRIPLRALDVVARASVQTNRETHMKKLGLNIETLEVQTFETGPEGGPRGTVHGAGNAAFLGTRVTRCGSECNVCTYTNCHPEQRTEIDCIC